MMMCMYALITGDDDDDDNEVEDVEDAQSSLIKLCMAKRIPSTLILYMIVFKFLNKIIHKKYSIDVWLGCFFYSHPFTSKTSSSSVALPFKTEDTCSGSVTFFL